MRATPAEIALVVSLLGLILTMGISLLAELVPPPWHLAIGAGGAAAAAIAAIAARRGVRHTRTKRQTRKTRARRGRQAHTRITTIETEHLRMTLHAGTGRLEGVVLTGTLKGQRLDALDLETLRTLSEQWTHEAESRRLLESWLDQAHEGWRENAPTRTRMSEAHARTVLNVTEDADRETIVRAWRQAMMHAHPDRGGSDEEAARVNEARERLLDAGDHA